MATTDHWIHKRNVEAFSPFPTAHDAVRRWFVEVGGFEEGKVRVNQNGEWVEFMGVQR